MGEPFPKWAAEELSSIRMEYVGTIKSSGYILEMDGEKKVVDVQVYEPLPDGRYIASMRLVDTLEPEEIEQGELYLLEIKVYKARLSSRLQQLFEQLYSIPIEIIFSFELAGIERLDEGGEEDTLNRRG